MQFEYSKDEIQVDEDTQEKRSLEMKQAARKSGDSNHQSYKVRSDYHYSQRKGQTR